MTIKQTIAVSSSAALMLLALAGCGGSGKPAATAIEVDPEYRSNENFWRIQRQESITSPDGWASLIGLHWLTLPSHYIGSSSRSGIRLLLGPPSMGLVQQNGDRVFFTPERGLALTLNGEPLKGRVELLDDRSDTPSVIGFDDGKGLMTLIRREDRRALRVKHADAETRTKFKGLDYWPLDPNWKIKATFTAHPAGTTLPITTIIGTTRDTPNPGALEFQRDGRTFRVEAIDDAGPTLLVMMADLTSGHETYGPGRYIDVPRPDAKGNVLIDFNRAYNPPCAFTAYGTCSLPPKENRIDLKITAGEKRYGGPPH